MSLNPPFFILWHVTCFNIYCAEILVHFGQLCQYSAILATLKCITYK